ncbi:unnamed protein product [Brachionus calyciflorus]|uniref:Uncharacterized protein n=1 Tax=Brachionus calyciflorus TaxID=104777 RepID=A0A813MJ36_9BILA|nr:unnamed protein product [Brachionus calyciflorus]
MSSLDNSDICIHKEIVVKTKFNSLNPGKLLTGLKNRILNHNSSSKKSSKNNKSKILDDNFTSDSFYKSSQSSLKSLINKSNSSFASLSEQACKLEKSARISKSKDHLIRRKSLKKSKASSKQFLDLKNSLEKNLKFTKHNNYNPKEKISFNTSLDSLGCSTIISEFSSSAISSFSSSSIDERLAGSSNQRNTGIKFKIDTDFKNELEKIISTSSTKINRNIPIQKIQHNQTQSSISLQTNQQTNFNHYPITLMAKPNFTDKLRNFINLLSGNLVKDYSDLLVDHENKFIINDDHTDINEESLKSILSDSSSLSDFTDSTNSAFNQLIKSGNQIGYDNFNIDEDKMLKILIKMLVKSCRIFDVATMKNDYKISYWRYANPVIAVLAHGSMRFENIEKKNVETQTCDFREENSITLENDPNFRTVIELKQKNRNLEIVSESLELSTLHDDDDDDEDSSFKEHIYENGLSVNFLCKQPVYENFNFLTALKESQSDIKSLEYLIRDVERHVSDKINQPIVLYENGDFFNNDNKKIDTEPEGILKINEKSKFLFRGHSIIRKNSNYYFRKSQNRAQDETLRDAENLSDLENESDIDQWIDENDNNNKNNLDKIALGDVLNNSNGKNIKYELEKLNENIDPIVHGKKSKTNPFKNSILSLSSSSSSTSLSNYSKLINTFQNIRKKPKTKSNNRKKSLNLNSNLNYFRAQKSCCLYKKDKIRNKNFNHFFDNKKNIFSKNLNSPYRSRESSGHLENRSLSSIMHEYENSKNLETFLKKYDETQTLSTTKSEKKFQNSFYNDMDTASRLRSHSLDSLEEEKNEEFTVECHHYIDNNDRLIDSNTHTQTNNDDDSPEIKIDFEYSYIDQGKQDQISNSYTIGDLKNNSKFNEESLVKQRARESLKFWKTEEEKFKQENTESNPNVSTSSLVQNSIFHTSQNSTLKRVNSRETKMSINSNSTQFNNGSQDRLNETQDQQVPSKRVKDRINIFESKLQDNKSQAPVMNFLKIKKGSHSNFERETRNTIVKPFEVVEKKPILSTVQSRIESLERKNLSEDTLELKNEEFCTQTYIEANQVEETTCTTIKTIDIKPQNDTQVIKLETLENSDSFDEKNQLEETFFENQIIEYKCEKADCNEIKISTCTLDRQKTINLSLNSLNSEYVLDVQENEKINQEDRPESEKSDTHVSIIEEEKRSSLSLHNSEVKSDDSEEEEEVEIVINLSQEKKIDENKINETLRNIVMHLIPTTRKAYVDDIVDGIKSQLNIEELNKINSPMDLPKEIVRFVQKRYTNLLNENLESEKNEPIKETSLEILVDSDRDSLVGQDRANSPFLETTELTVVKEIRKEIMSSSESEIKTEIQEENNIFKVDEETLYIVEKIRQVKTKTEEESSKSTSFVDTEIRKNFELKPKMDESVLSRGKDLRFLINDLKKSIFKSNLHFAEMQSHGLINEINDYQLHYFKTDEKEQASILVILFDKQNDENLKYNLEQNYQKSIVDTHLSLNRKAQINIVANLNLFYIDDIDSDINLKDNFYDSHANYINLVNNSKFYDFSIFKRLKDAHQLSHLTDVSTYFLPIGKYFVKVQYKHAIHTNDLALNKIINETRTEKESIVDLSLLPLAIRAQLVYECEQFIDKKDNTTEIPEVNILAIDSFLLQMEINKKRDDLIRNIIVRQFNYTPKEAEEFLTKKKSFNELENLNEFINRLEVDLDSYYICEKVESLIRETNTQRNNEDLVKLNRLDALASYQCVQKYKIEICDIVKQTNFKYPIFDESYKIFYLIDNGNHYKCMLPIEDLNNSISNEANLSIEDEEDPNLKSNSMAIENIQKRQNYIFSKDLQNVFTNDNGTSSVSNHQNSKSPELTTKKLEKNLNDKSESQKVKPKTQNEARLELHLENLTLNENSRDSRDKIISNEVYKMFNTIRDHQSSTVKAKGEMNIKRKKKRSGTWGYSSDKRHVIAKVMELPYVEDMTQLTKKTGISDLKDLEKSILNDEDSSEKVFVRIDDFLNKKVSQSIQRSYSFDYLNKNAGPKFRIKYVKIPNQGIKSHNLPSNFINTVQETNECLSASYDLRYLSILKLLEEERLSKDQYFGFYDEADCKEVLTNDTAKKIDKPYASEKTWKEMENFLSKNNIDEEIEKVKQQQYKPRPDQTPKQVFSPQINHQPTTKVQSCDKNPTLIIKEKSFNAKHVKVSNNSVILNKIDSELEKIEKQSIQNQKIDSGKVNLAENVKIYNLPEQDLNALMGNLDLYKNYSPNDVVYYYDYNGTNLLNVIPNMKHVRSDYESKSKNGSLNNLSQQGMKNSPNPQSTYFSPKNSGSISSKNLIRNNRYEDFSDELLRSQQNLYQIVDFQDQVINSALSETIVYQKSGNQGQMLNGPTKLTKANHLKSNPNLSYQSKMTNLQSLIMPNQSTNGFENEKLKRNF